MGFWERKRRIENELERVKDNLAKWRATRVGVIREEMDKLKSDHYTTQWDDDRSKNVWHMLDNQLNNPVF